MSLKNINMKHQQLSEIIELMKQWFNHYYSEQIGNVKIRFLLKTGFFLIGFAL